MPKLIEYMRCGTPRARAIAAFCMVARAMHAEAGPHEQQVEADQHRDGRHEQHEPIDREGVAPTPKLPSGVPMPGQLEPSTSSMPWVTIRLMPQVARIESIGRS